MANKNMKMIKQIAMVLLVIGGLTWGLIGILNFNLVEFISFGMAWLQKTIYVLVGISAVIIAPEVIKLK